MIIMMTVISECRFLLKRKGPFRPIAILVVVAAGWQMENGPRRRVCHMSSGQDQQSAKRPQNISFLTNEFQILGKRTCTIMNQTQDKGWVGVTITEETNTEYKIFPKIFQINSFLTQKTFSREFSFSDQTESLKPSILPQIDFK